MPETHSTYSSPRILAAVVTAAALMGACFFIGRASVDEPAGEPVAAPAASDAPAPNPALDKFVKNSTGSQLSYYRISDGMRMGTATERYARPALSLTKLYIAEYVLNHGTEAEKFEALDMVSDSSDAAAAELFEKYPDSIDDVARRYGLYSTRSDEDDRWGYSVTSTYDAVSFIAQLKEKDSTHPILVAMSHADATAADGYPQDFGTATLRNVIGTKFGWSNSRELHSSVSFGENFVVAAAVTGSAEDLTDFVKSQVTGDKLRAASRHHVNLERAKKGLEPLPETAKPKKPKVTATTTKRAPKSAAATSTKRTAQRSAQRSVEPRASKKKSPEPQVTLSSKRAPRTSERRSG